MTRMVAVGVCLLAIQARSTGSDDGLDDLRKLKRSEVRQAIQTYEAAIADSRQAHDKKVAAATKELSDVLEAAQTKAAAENKLDDAVVIRDARKTLETMREETLPRNAGLMRSGTVWTGRLKWIRGANVGKFEDVTLVISDIQKSSIKSFYRWQHSFNVTPQSGYVLIEGTIKKGEHIQGSC